MAEQRVRGLSLRRKVTGWLGAILAVTLVSIGMATAVGRWTSTAFDAMLADNSACYTVQDALAAETKAFSRMVREPSRENTEEYQTACEITEASLAELPFDYEKIGEERYARTWNLLQGYAGYQKYRDAFLRMGPAADTYVDQMYRVMELQDYLSEYALRLTQATLEQENAAYSAQADQLEQLPWVYLGLFLMALALMLVLLGAKGCLAAGITLPGVGYVDLGIAAPLLWEGLLVALAECARIADGMDGIVCGTSFAAMLGLMMLETQLGWFPLAVFPAALAGALMAFLLWDFPPAKLNPGRCGCLYAAGAIGCIPLCIGYAELSIPLALPFWVEGGMVVLQVLFCRWKGRPLFAAAPLHRWLEKRGMSAVNIFYSLCALSVCGLALAVCLARWA